MKSTPQQGNFDTCWLCSLIPPPIPPITKSHVFIRRRIRNSTPSLVRTWTATRHPNIPVIAGLSDTTERTANAIQINEAKKKNGLIDISCIFGIVYVSKSPERDDSSNPKQKWSTARFDRPFVGGIFQIESRRSRKRHHEILRA